MAPSYGEAIYRQIAKWTAFTRIEFVPDAKKPGSKSYDRYQSYAKSRYVGEALRLGAKPEDLVHDYHKKYLKMHKDQRVKVPPGVVGEEEEAIFSKFLRRMRGPAGINIRKMNAKKLKAEERLRKMGIEMKDMRDEKSCQETNDLQTLRLAADCAAADILADIERTGRKTLEKDITSVLELWAFRKNESRLNVLPEGKSWVNSDTLGLIHDRKGCFLVTKPTTDYPHFMALLTRFLNDRRPPELDCDFPFTTISLNFGYAAKRHRDSGNLGPSMIRAFGKFKGGNLCYWADDDKSIALDNLRDEDKVSLDISQGFALFDGNRAHEVDSFQGERYSVVFFSVDKFWKASEESLNVLRERGYNIPTDEIMNKARKLLPAPRGYSGCQSLTSMFGSREKCKVFHWIEGQEEREMVPPSSSPSSSSSRIGRPPKSTQEPPKSADLKALFFGGGSTPPSAAGAGTSSQSSTAASSGEGAAASSGDSAPEDSSKSDASQKAASLKESSAPAATPPRKESSKGSKRPLGVSCEKMKRARKQQEAKAESAAKKASRAAEGPKAESTAKAAKRATEGPKAAEGPKTGETPAAQASALGADEPGEPLVEQLASTHFHPDAVAKGSAWCNRLGLIARALQGAEAKPQMPTIALSNAFRAMLHASEEPLPGLLSAVELLVRPAADPLPAEAVAAAIATAFGGKTPAAGADLAKAAASACSASAERPAAPLTLAEALAEFKAAKEVPAEAVQHAAKLLLAVSDGGEAAALARLLLGKPALPRSAVLRALAHACALTKPPRSGAPAERRAFPRSEGQHARLVATDKALALAYGETGGNLEQLLGALLADCRPAELFGRCGPRPGSFLLPMKAKEARDLEHVLSELTGSPVLAEQRYLGELVQVHKLPDGRISVFGSGGAELSEGLGEALTAALAEALRAAGACILEGVLQRDAGILQLVDCLHAEGRPLTRQSLRERRAVLDRTVGSGDLVQIALSEEFPLDDPPTDVVLSQLLEEARGEGLKGVMLKRLDRQYEAGAVDSDSSVALLLPGA